MIKKALALITSTVVALTAIVTGGITASAASGATGVGLAEHAMTAYYENWSYVYGGSTPGAVDCSGLFVTYKGVGGVRTDLLGSSSESGLVSNGIPRIHGLGLWQPGHVGIYVGGGMAVDARDESSGIVYHNVSSKKWEKWFKVAGVTYPTTGWQTFEGNRYYYENGQYIVNCTRIIDGKTYRFNSSGIANGGSAASAEEIAAANAQKEADRQAAIAAQQAEEEAAAEAAAQKKAEEEAKKKAEEEAAKKAAAEKKAKEEAAKKAAAEKKAAEEAADDQGSLMAQSLLMETVPLEQKSMPKVKAAVIPEVEEVSPVNMTMAVSVTAAVVVVLSGMAFLLFKLNHRYIPAYCRRGAGSLKNLFFKTKKHLKK